MRNVKCAPPCGNADQWRQVFQMVARPTAGLAAGGQAHCWSSCWWPGPSWPSPCPATDLEETSRGSTVQAPLSELPREILGEIISEIISEKIRRSGWPGPACLPRRLPTAGAAAGVGARATRARAGARARARAGAGARARVGARAMVRARVRVRVRGFMRV